LDRSNAPGILPDVYDGLPEDYKDLHYRRYSYEEPKSNIQIKKFEKWEALDGMVLWCQP
jgi:hypothetical protein